MDKVDERTLALARGRERVLFALGMCLGVFSRIKHARTLAEAQREAAEHLDEMIELLRELGIYPAREVDG